MSQAPPNESYAGLTYSSLLGATGVAAAAFYSHGLSRIATADQVRWWGTACAMQLVTVPVIVMLFVWSMSRPDQKPLRGARRAGWLLAAGVSVFSGSLYAMACGGPRGLGAVTPLGGVLLIAGWIAVALLRPASKE